MASSGFPLFIVILISCFNLSGQESALIFNKSFSTNLPIDNKYMTINISKKGEEIFAERNGHKINDDFAPINLMFVETENILIDPDGFFHVIDTAKRVWFIPFTFGLAPVEILEGRKKFKYGCNCRSWPLLSSEGVCTSVRSGDTLSCGSTIGMSCFTNEPGCRGCTGFFDSETMDLFNIYTTGIVMQGDTVYLNEPDEYKPNPNNQPIQFIEDDNGNIYLRSDYEKMHGIKKD